MIGTALLFVRRVLREVSKAPVSKSLNKNHSRF